jgi:hypothetical protein
MAGARERARRKECGPSPMSERGCTRNYRQAFGGGGSLLENTQIELSIAASRQACREWSREDVAFYET